MKKKWTPHIIAVTAFVVFIVLGLGSASAPADGASETGPGGIIRIAGDVGYYYVISKDSREYYTNSSSGGSVQVLVYPTNSHSVKDDGEYTIYYHAWIRGWDGKVIDNSNGDFRSVYGHWSSWPSKTVNVSNGAKVTVNIP